MPKLIKLYYDLLNQPSRAVYMFFEINKIPYDPVPTNVKDASSSKLLHTRFQSAPSMNDNGLILTENVAIFKYLTSEKLIPEHWYPKENKLRGKINEYLEWQQSNLNVNCSMYTELKWSGNDEKLIKDKKEVMEKDLDFIENVWLKDSGNYMVGKKITVADLLAAADLEQPSIVGYNACEGRPRIEEWLHFVKLAVKPFYDDSHEDIRKLAETNGNNFNVKATAKNC